MKQTYKTLLLWFTLIVIFVTIYQALKSSSTGQKIDFSEFYKQATEKDEQARANTNIAKVTVRGDEIEGEYKAGTPSRFTTVGHLSPKLERELIENGVRIAYERDDANGFWLSIIGTWLPMVFLFVIFIFFMRQLQAGGGKAMSFGKSRHHVLNESNNKVTFKDVAGIEEAKEELQEIVQFLKEPKKFTRLGGRIPKGVLLMGPPGTGKTLLARGVAGEAGVPFFSISGSDFVEMFVGVGASRVRDLFEQGKKNAPCLIFVDEIDAVGRHRGAGLGGGHDEREQTLNQLLVEMDGFESSEGVIIVAATNRPDVLDPALLRPGRFDRRVVVHLPDVAGREAILKVHTRKVPLAKNANMNGVARATPGMSGADLANLVNEAALVAARRNKDVVENEDFDYARDKVIMGPERRSMVIPEKEKRLTAYHEAGHTLVGMKLPGYDPVHKVTIIPRGMALGVTQHTANEDRFSVDDGWILNFIAMAMGGRAAEEIVFARITTGAGNDIERATDFARRYVSEWGMSNLGPVAFGSKDEALFLGRDIQRHHGMSEHTAVRVDREVHRIVTEQYERARQLILENREALDAIALALLELETLDLPELRLIMDGVSVEELKKRRVVDHEDPAATAAAGTTPAAPREKRPTPSILPAKPNSEET